MDRFNAFFQRRGSKNLIEIGDVRFELRADKNNCSSRLYFTDNALKERYITSSVMKMVPFGPFGVACLLRLPQPYKHILLCFWKNNKLFVEKGCLLDESSLVYTIDGEVRYCNNILGERLVISKKAFEKLGYRGDVYFEKFYFWIPSDTVELVPKFYFDYYGDYQFYPRRTAICSSIMCSLRIFISKEPFKIHKIDWLNKKLGALSWNACSADVEDLLVMIALETAGNNVDDDNVNTVLKTVDCLVSNNYESAFTRYFELFYTYSNQISKEYENQGVDSENEMNGYMYMLKNMHIITEQMIHRADFDELLSDYKLFETAAREIIERL